ncbi:MAG: hypothetical protein AAF939_21725 [Planctomycetota bacterium]
MKFFRFWGFANSDSQTKFGEHITTWGCSNESLEEAIANANRRANQLVQKVNHPEPGLYEQYTHGPLREEIIEEFAAPDSQSNEPFAIISRNNYGALILNTSNLLFADIDSARPSWKASGGFFSRLFGGSSPDPTNQLIEKIENLCRKSSGLGMRLYRTKAGFRVMVTSRTFDPMSSETNQILKKLGSDRLYEQLCHRQECFRARLSPKPWRMDFTRPAFRFPYMDYAQKYMDDWVEKYVQLSANYATCALIGNFGSRQYHPVADTIVRLHDFYALSDNDLPLA